VKSIRRSYKIPFLVEKSKLGRLVTVVREKAAEVNNIRERYEVHLSSRKLVETTALDEVLQLDNSERNRVERLTVVFEVIPTGEPDAAEQRESISVDFDGRLPAEVEIVVRSDNTRWATEVFALAEEQVERVFQKEVMYKLANRRELFPLLVAFLAAALGMFTSMFAQDVHVPHLVGNMWLTETDMKELAPTLQDPRTPDATGEVLRRQLRNIQAERERGSTIRRVLGSWRTWLLALPVFVAIPCFLYLLLRCYPGAVFSWGDEEGRFARLVSKRRLVWSVIIGFAVIEVLSNLFGVGLGGVLGK